MTAEWGGAGSLDEKMIADLRAWRGRITPAPSEAERSAGHPYSVQLRLEEVDALLAAVADRDTLRREACEMPDERAENVTPIKAVHYFGAARVVPVDLATLVDARVEEDERVIAWDAIAAHPFFRDCYGAKTSLLDAMLAKLTASTFEAPIPDEIRKRAGEPAMRTPEICSRCGGSIYYSRPSHAWVHSGAVPEDCAPRPKPARRTVNCRCSVTPILHDHPSEGEVTIEIQADVPEGLRSEERPKLRDVIADALGEGACSCYESVPKQVERIALAIEREIAAGGIS